MAYLDLLEPGADWFYHTPLPNQRSALELYFWVGPVTTSWTVWGPPWENFRKWCLQKRVLCFKWLTENRQVKII